MSTIAVDKIKPSAGGTEFTTRGVAKAWVNFNGTGVVAIRDSENVSSVTDNGTGDYTINLTNDMSTVNYCPVAAGSYNETELASYVGRTIALTALAVGSCDATAQVGTGSAFDFLNMYMSLNGDLA